MKKLMITFRSLILLSSLAFNVYAQDAGAKSNPIGSLLPIIVIFGIFYVMIIMPQQKKAKQHQKMLNALKRDDRIITSGGIYGTVISVKGDIVEVKIAEEVRIQVARSAIGTILPPENQAITPEIVK